MLVQLMQQFINKLREIILTAKITGYNDAITYTHWLHPIKQRSLGSGMSSLTGAWRSLFPASKQFGLLIDWNPQLWSNIPHCITTYNKSILSYLPDETLLLILHEFQTPTSPHLCLLKAILIQQCHSSGNFGQVGLKFNDLSIWGEQQSVCLDFTKKACMSFNCVSSVHGLPL